jgi:hypothetical protein
MVTSGLFASLMFSVALIYPRVRSFRTKRRTLHHRLLASGAVRPAWEMRERTW